MSEEYSETEALIPRAPFLVLVLTLAATGAFLVFLHFYDSNLMSPERACSVSAAFAAVAVAAYFLKVRIIVKDGVLRAGIVRCTEAPLEHVIDTRVGDIDTLRDYSGWGTRKVRFRTYAAHGVDTAVSVKLAGFVVLTVTTEHPEELERVLRDRITE